MLENNTEMIKSLRNRTVRLEHEGDYWTADENERLKSMFSDNIGISEISLTLQRTEPAVMQQIEKMDLYGRKANPKRRKKNKKGRCPCEKCPVLMAETARKHTTRMIRRKYVRRIR